MSDFYKLYIKLDEETGIAEILGEPENGYKEYTLTDPEKVVLQLSPYSAAMVASILSLDIEQGEALAAVKESIMEYLTELSESVTDEHCIDMQIKSQINQALGRE